MIHDALLILWDCSQAVNKEYHASSFSAGEEEIMKRICDIAKYHHRIQNYVETTTFQARKLHSKTSNRNYSLYSQAFSEGVTETLQSYKKSLVEVETLVIGNQLYTLSFVYSYVEKYRGLFMILNRIITMIKERKLTGGQVLGLVHQHILSGNEMVHDALVRILSCINKVFLNQLCSWLLYGELKDPYQEFLVIQTQVEGSNVSVASPSTINTCLKSLPSSMLTLDCGYSLNSVMIPYFIPVTVAQDILFIGKTVILFGTDPKKLKRNTATSDAFLLPMMKDGHSHSKRFTIWQEQESEFHEKLQKLNNPQEFEVCNLKAIIREIKECVTKHLWTVAVTEAHLFHELQLMKDFYLLGRGELFLELLRLTAPMLDNPTTRTGTRDMNHAFQLATRAVLLGNNTDVEKFSFELPYVKSISSNSTFEDDSTTVSDGWSSLILKYDFKWPLHLLFTPDVLARYNDMFRLLLRIKKTQHDLHVLWKTYKHSTNFAMCQLHNKLMFLMDNLQHYLQSDVLETNFSTFMGTARDVNDFEKLKKAHGQFLQNVFSQSFLSVATTSSDSNHSVRSGEVLNNPVFCNIMELLKLCHSFCSITTTLEDQHDEDYYLRGYSERYNRLVKQLTQLLVALRDQPCGVYLARLLMRLDFNRWLSGEAQLTQSVTNMLR